MTLKLAAAIASAALAVTIGGVVTQPPAIAAEAIVRTPPPKLDLPEPGTTATAVFAGGCFWGVQAVYAHVSGVRSAVSGYAGGTAETARYERVGEGDTGHAESVRITYDPRVISYGKLLQIYFSVVADPTQLNRQGPDTGTQYRSAIFPLSDSQRKVASAYIAQLSAARLWQRPIVTRIERAQAFYPAEAYHQDYFFRNPRSGYIIVNDKPKVEGLKALYPQLFREKPALVRARA